MTAACSPVIREEDAPGERSLYQGRPRYRGIVARRAGGKGSATATSRTKPTRQAQRRKARGSRAVPRLAATSCISSLAAFAPRWLPLCRATIEYALMKPHCAIIASRTHDVTTKEGAPNRV